MNANRKHLPDMLQETVNTTYPSTKLLTVEDLCERFRVRRTWVYSQTKLTGPGSIPRIRLGKYLRFRESDVMAWLESKQPSGE